MEIKYEFNINKNDRVFKDCMTLTNQISKEALNVAMENAVLHKVKDRIQFIQSDLFDVLNLIKYRGKKIDIITSNPPYISKKELQGLPPEVKFEPPVALDGGDRGLNFYRRIVDNCPNFLRDGGYLIMEMGWKQSGNIQSIIKSSEQFEVVGIEKDYSEIDRVIVARKF